MTWFTGNPSATAFLTSLPTQLASSRYRAPGRSLPSLRSWAYAGYRDIFSLETRCHEHTPAFFWMISSPRKAETTNAVVWMDLERNIEP